ncbi:MAG: hypothetical protein Q4D02_01960 [Clostridia bacterium]|nr:hypothetical protein [Clostridia bacterium]
MDLRQVCILMLAGIIILHFIAQLIEKTIKEHINKNRVIKRENKMFKEAYIKMINEQEYKNYKLINKQQFLNCVIK